MAKHPQTESEMASDEFQCAECGKRTSGNSYFTITARGLVDKGKTGSGRLYSGADLTTLSIWHVTDFESRQGHEQRLCEGEWLASLFFCSADCMRNYLLKSIDELVKRAKQA